MKKYCIIAVLVATLLLAGCAKQSTPQDDKNMDGGAVGGEIAVQEPSSIPEMSEEEPVVSSQPTQSKPQQEVKIEKPVQQQSSAASSSASSAPSRPEKDPIPLTRKLKVQPYDIASIDIELITATQQKIAVVGGETAHEVGDILLNHFFVYDVKDYRVDPKSGEATRYTLTLQDGTVMVLYDVGLLSVDDKENIYCIVERQDIVLPSWVEWKVYNIDPETGLKVEVKPF